MRHWISTAIAAALTTTFVAAGASTASADDAPPVVAPPMVAPPVVAPPVAAPPPATPTPQPAPLLPLAQPTVPWSPPVLLPYTRDVASRPPSVDSTLATGIVDLSLGATLVGFSLFFMEDESDMGIFAGMGLGTIAVGAPMVAAGAKKVTYARTSEGLYAFGSVLVSMGGTISGSALGAIVGDHLQRARRERDLGVLSGDGDYARAGVATSVGAVIAIVGSALMVFGATEKSQEAQDQDAQQRAERRAMAERAAFRGDVPTVPRSVPRRTAGQVLVGIGTASFIGATIAGVHFSDCGGDLCGFGHLFTTIPLAVNGVLTTAIGVPLWVSGAGHVRIDELAQDETWIPTVSVGAGTASMSMRF